MNASRLGGRRPLAAFGQRVGQSGECRRGIGQDRQRGGCGRTRLCRIDVDADDLAGNGDRGFPQIGLGDFGADGKDDIGLAQQSSAIACASRAPEAERMIGGNDALARRWW